MQDEDDRRGTNIFGDVEKVTQIGSVERVYINQTYEPLLQVRLIPSPGGACVVQSLPNLNDEIALAIAIREAAKRNLPSLEWVASQSDAYVDGPEPSNYIEGLLQQQMMAREYWHKVQAWYESTLLSIITTYEKLRLSKRTFYLYLEVVNLGKAPAKRISVDLTFPPGPSVEDPMLDSVYQVDEPPRREESPLKDSQEPIEVAKDPNVSLPEWSLTLGKPPIGPEVNFPRDYVYCAANKVQDYYVAKVFHQRLEHGQVVPFKPIKFFWGLDVSPQPFVVKFRTHAENQPDDQYGEIEVDVLEVFQSA
jgi:hypothetical protein